MTSVQTNEPAICSTNTTIQEYTTKKKYFESAVDFLLITAPANKHQVPSNHRISILSRKLGKVKIGPNNGLEVRYNKRNEYNKPSNEEQNVVR